MRLVFEKDKQQELIKEEKTVFALSLPSLANKLKIKIGKLNAYYYNNLLMPEEIFERFLLKENYRKFILDKRENNWGQKIGGNSPEAGYIKKINEPNESEELAEFYGIMLGDGNSTKIKRYKVGVYQIRIVGDSRFDKEYLMNFVKPLIERLFNIKVHVFNMKNKNGLNVCAYGLKLIEFLESKGFTPGDKIRNQLCIPAWIKNDEKFLRACLRGLYDTDGSIYKLTNQNSYQICFTNYNATLLNDVRNSLISLGINPSRITKEVDIVITKKDELRKFLNGVGFHNFKHSNKVRMWNL